MSLRLLLLVLVCFALFSAARAKKSVTQADKVEHFVVLMLENRAFDHMCGWQKRKNAKINGLTGQEYNIANGTKWYVNDTCPYINPFDPNHGFDDTTFQLMGKFGAWLDPAPMSGFAENHFLTKKPEFETVMHGFPPERVPSISTLAEEFAIFDEYYCSLPGPTVPNRLYFHSGTSHGNVGGPATGFIEGFPQRTIFDLLDDQKVTWAAYYQDVSDLLYLRNTRKPQNIVNIKPYDEFLTAAAEGTLPAYTWVSPQFYPSFSIPARDQHPDHDVVEGEKMIAEVYAALRNGPKWGKTAFLVTYDEHGGFYDHVPPPQGVPNPDGLNSHGDQYPFNFTREGIRVCTILASPYVPKGTVIHSAPQSGKHYEHSSLLNTLKAFFPAIDPAAKLTERSTWAPAYDDVLSLDTPRTDCPTSLPIPSDDNPERTQAVLSAEKKRAPNCLQKSLYRMLEGVHGRSGADVQRFQSQEELGEYVRATMEKAKEKIRSGDNL